MRNWCNYLRPLAEARARLLQEGRRRERPDESPEEAAGLLGRLFFVWAFPMLWLGYTRGRTELEDLPPLPQGDRPENVVTDFCNMHRRRTTTAQQPEREWLFWALASLTRPVFLQGLLCHLVQLCCSYAQPILLHNLLQKISSPSLHSGAAVAITMQALGIALAVMGMWVFAERAWFLFVRADLRAQVAVSHMTFRRSLYLSGGASGYAIGDLQNHFSTDCGKPTSVLIHWIHAGVLEAIITISVVTWHLTMLIGSAGVIAIIVVVAFAPAQFLVSRQMKRQNKRIQQCRDVRGRLCNEFLSAMRVVKCFGLEDVALRMVTSARNDELEAQWGKRRLFPVANFIASSASLFGTVAAFAWLELVMDRPISSVIAFTVLTWNNMLKNSIISVPNQINSIMDAYVSLKRIQVLLDTDGDRRWLGTPQVSAEPCDRNGCPYDFVLENCDIGWPDPHGHRGVRGLNLQVRHGEFLLICGPVGCGKSTMLQAMAGAHLVLAGRCRIAGVSTAYVAQRPWLLCGTLIENVAFGKVQDTEALMKALNCCSLAQDLQALPFGIATQVGEEGVQLSGGQKQRVSLARAVYSEADVVLMDDVLSALDAHVGHHVWEAAICTALAGRTRVMVTHQVQFCSHPAVDRILLFGPDGVVKHLGTFNELQACGINLGVDAVNVASEGSERKGGLSPAKSASPSSILLMDRSGDASGEETRRLGTILRTDMSAYVQASGGFTSATVIALFIFVYYGTQLAANLQLAVWTDANTKGEAHDEPEVHTASRAYLAQYSWLCLIVGVSCFTFYLGIQLVALKASRSLHLLFMKGLLSAELRFFDLTPTGRALNRCLKDMANIDDLFPAAFRSLFESLMNSINSIVIISCFAWQALLAVPPFALAYWRIMTVYRWPARDIKRLEGVSRSPAMSHFSDSIKGATTIRAYKHEDRFYQRNLELLGNNQRTVYWFWIVQGWVSMAQEVLGTVLIAIICGVVGYRASIGVLSPGVAGLSLSYALSMPRDLMWLSRRIANMEVEFVSIERIMEYIRLPSEGAQVRIRERCETDLSSAQCPPPLCCAVHATDVNLRYTPDGPWVLDALSLQLRKGKRTAIVGRTGCGKSSLISVLVRLYPIQNGHLSVHGKDIMRVSLSALRSTIRILLQDPIFFSGTIRSNLLCEPPEPGASLDTPICEKDEALWQVLAKAGLEGRVRNMERGLTANVDEAGQNFSQGEKQLLCLARVLLELPASTVIETDRSALGPRILMCDEPTSACDLDTDEHIHGTLLGGLPADWTLAVVCHRLYRIREFDDVFVLESGKVVESGTPAELLAAKGSSLGQLCRQQGLT